MIVLQDSPPIAHSHAYHLHPHATFTSSWPQSIQRSRNKHKLFTQCIISPALVARGARLLMVRSLRVLSQLNLHLIACDSAVFDTGTVTGELRRACHGSSKGGRHTCDRSSDNKQTVAHTSTVPRGTRFIVLLWTSRIILFTPSRLCLVL